MERDFGITLVCSNFNSAKWVEGYLENVNAQHLKEFDIKFIDAGSTDGSFEMIKNFSFREGVTPEFISRPECSIYEAWNIGFSRAETGYCINFNTDDRLFDSSLLSLQSYARKSPDVDVFHSTYFVVSDEKHTAWTEFRNVPEVSKEELLRECFVGPFPMVKRQAAIDAGLFNPEFTISGDYEMWLRMESKGMKFQRVTEPMGTYYFNPTGMSTDPSKFEEHLKQDTKIREMYR
jgi:GT2 family glycosyltransferase